MIQKPTVRILRNPDNSYQKAMYLLVNYRRIVNKFDTLVPEDEEYLPAESYIKKMNEYLGKLKDTDIPDTGFLKKSKLNRDEKKKLYIDTLHFSYFSPDYMSSDEIIKILTKKYGLKLNPARLTKLKSNAVKFFSFVV